MQIKPWALAPLLAATLCAVAPQGLAAQSLRKPAPGAAELAALGFKEVTIPHQNATRHFLVAEPPAAPTSIVILLHGGGQSMRRAFSSNAGATLEWPAVARADNALLLAPNGTNFETGDPKGDQQSWNDLRGGEGVRTSSADDAGFILAMLDWAKQRHPAAASRVLVTGASNGGMMTYRLLIEAPERFSAGAAFVASLPSDLSRAKQPSRPTPLLIMGGTNDPLVKWDGGAIPGKRGTVTSMPETVRWWLDANKAQVAAPDTALLPDADPSDSCRIQRQLHAAKPGGAPVAFYTMQGGGHAMPSRKHAIPDNFIVRRVIGTVCRDVEAAHVVWEFFQQYGLKL